MIVRYDKDIHTSYGIWDCPTCGSSFFGGGEALHNKGCTTLGYEACTYRVGPEEIQDTLRRNEKYGLQADWVEQFDLNGILALNWQADLIKAQE